MRRFAVVVLMLACEDPAAGGADQGVGAACVQSTLVAQCPPGSNPLLGATAAGLCAGGPDLRNMQGHVTGRCYGEGACIVACQFAAACACGVESITREGVVCVPCEDTNPCGDGQCAAGEDPVSCPQDCAGDCQPGATRCQDVAIESCNLRGRWEAIACPQGEGCVQPDPNAAPRCAREDIVVGRDGGVADGGGPRISGRLLLGDAEYPGSGVRVRPGGGRDLVRRGRFGVLRVCQGNVAQAARCREAVSLRPRDELVNVRAYADVQVSVPPSGDHLRLWGTDRIVGFSFDGLGPDFGARPTLEAFCSHQAEYCRDRPGECDNGVPPELEIAYNSWTYGSSAMRCLLEEPECSPPDQCLLSGRVFGYDANRSIARPDAGSLSADGRLFAFWTDEKNVAVFDTTTQTVTAIGDVGSYFGGSRFSLAFSADNRFVAATAVSGQTFDSDTLLVVWPTTGGEPVAAIPLEDGHPLSVALSPDGRVAAVARRNPPSGPRIEPVGIDVVDVTTSSLMFRILPAEEPNPANLNCFSHVNGGLAFSPAGDRLAAGAHMIRGLGCQGAAWVEIWNLATGEKERTLPGPIQNAVEVLRYSPDGTTLAVASRVSQSPADVVYDLSLWDTASGALITSLDRAVAREILGTTGLEYSEDGRFLVTWGPGNGDDEDANGQVTVYGPAVGEAVP